MDFACNRSACLNCYDETELFKVLQESEAEINPLVYQNYCIEKQSIEEISKEFNVNEESVQLMVQYYDKKAAS